MANKPPTRKMMLTSPIPSLVLGFWITRSPFFFRLLWCFHHVNRRCYHMRQTGAKSAGNKKSWAQLPRMHHLVDDVHVLFKTSFSMFQYVSIHPKKSGIVPSKFCPITIQEKRKEHTLSKAANHPTTRKSNSWLLGSAIWVGKKQTNLLGGFQEGRVVAWETIWRQ